MFDSLRQALKRRLKKTRQPQPLISHDTALRLVQHTRGRFLPCWSQLRRVGKILSKGERNALRLSFVFGLASTVWLGLAILSQYRISVPAIGGEYVEGVVGTPELINPIFSSLSDVDTDLSRLMFTGLMRYDDKGRLVPDIASSVNISDDKLTYTFQLRRDVLWHDGEPLTAQDVAFTIETIQNPTVGSPLLQTFQGVDVSVTDPYTVSFKLKEPFTAFLSSLTVGLIPEHVLGDVAPERMRLNKYNLQPVGTGPYKFSKLLKDDTGYIYRYELVRNDHYYRTGPYISLFVMQFFGDYEGPTGAIQALREQKIDGLSFVPHDLKESVARKHIVLHTLLLPQYTALFLNQDHNVLLKDKVVRQALEYSLDKNRIIRETLKGDGQVIGGPLLPSSPGFSASTTKSTFALDDANKLLDANWSRVSADEYRKTRHDALIKEMGEMASGTLAALVATSTTSAVTSTEQSLESLVQNRLNEEIQAAQTFYRKDKGGNILTLNIVTADTPEYKQVAELIAGSWQEIGVRTTVELVPSKDIPRQVLKERDYDVLLYGLIVGSDPDQYPFWHSSQINFPGLNLSRYSNRTVDDLLVKARATTDVSAVSSLYEKIQDQIISDRPTIFLYTPTYTYATNDRMYGIVDNPVYQPADRFNLAASWYMKTKGQWKVR